MSGGFAGTPAAQLVVSRDTLEQMNSQFAKTWQRPPTEEEQKGIREDFVRNEIFYREAVAAGLDRDDEVLKRRLRQKMEFIYEDVSSWAEPTDADLAAFMDAHRDKYLSDPRVAFRQVYFNPDRRGANIESDAWQALVRLNEGADPGSFGDPTMLEAEVSLAPLWDVKRQYGDAFGNSLLEQKPGVWAGPIKSGLGLHLVLLKLRQEGRLPNLSEIRDNVKRDWIAAKQKELKDAAYAKIRERYTVTVEPPKADAAPMAAKAMPGGAAK